ncbi:MAG: hypothetical protein LBF00_00205 [Mycoplasmataceae bacterium]|nr:hypothetical protein [Mycoplasmataceae bacterium]
MTSGLRLLVFTATRTLSPTCAGLWFDLRILVSFFMPTLYNRLKILYPFSN